MLEKVRKTSNCRKCDADLMEGGGSREKTQENCSKDQHEKEKDLQTMQKNWRSELFFKALERIRMSFKEVVE